MRFILSFITLVLFICMPMRVAWAEAAEQNMVEDTLLASTQTPQVLDVDESISGEVSSQENRQSASHQGIAMTVNINSADAGEIAAMLKGVGAKKAQAIVEYRSEFGQFTSLDDLQKVKGIGAATINKNRDRILF